MRYREALCVARGTGQRDATGQLALDALDALLPAGHRELTGSLA